MTTGISKIPDNGALLFEERFIDTSDPSGLWFCQNAEDAQTIGINAVSKALLAKWTDLNVWADWVEQFPFMMVAMPDTPERDEAIEELMARFSIPIMVPTAKAWRQHNSVKSIKEDYGEDGINYLLLEADEIPAKGLINIAEVDCTKKMQENRIVSGFPELDREMGGFNMGELTVWTGKRGEGKSTNLGQIGCIEAINQGHTVCVYSGEMPKEQFKLGLLQQAAGKYTEYHADKRTGKLVYNAMPDVVPYIDRWWDKKLFLTDIQRKNAHDEESILKVFDYAYRRYGADVFIVDNIMTASLKDEDTLGFWRAQSSFTGRLVAFAKKLNVCVHLVAHPRKTSGPIDSDDVGGSSDITNRADNVIKLERVPEERVEELGYSTMLTVLKNREFGARCQLKLSYNEQSRRLYPAGGNPFKAYSWQKFMEQEGTL